MPTAPRPFRGIDAHGRQPIRANAAKRGYDARWQKARRRFLLANPLCRACLAEGLVTAATVVDHVVPHRGERRLFWDRANWQALCGPCHNRKTRRGQ